MFEKTKYQLAGFGNATNGNYFNFNFGLAPVPGKGKMHSVGSFHSCREGLIGDMRGYIMKPTPSIPTDKMRMIFLWYLSKNNLKKDEAEHRAWLNRGLSILHAYEKLAGWPLTKVFEMDTGKNFIKAYYFLSSRRWIKASYLVSLYVLMVRLGRNSALTGFKNAAGFEKLANSLIDKYTAANGSWKTLPASFTGDTGWLKKTLPYWSVVFKGYSEMFRKMKITHYWSEERLSGSSNRSSEGIAYLCEGTTSYQKARQKLLELSKKTKK